VGFSVKGDNMQLGMIGLGKMGGNMALRLLKGGHEVVAYDRSDAAVNNVVKGGGVAAKDLKDLVKKLKGPKTVWVMLPAGEITDNTVTELAGLLDKGDCIIDGGNSKFTDDIRRSKELAPKGLDYMDVGTSGGIWGLKRGYSLMIGGPKKTFDRLEPIFKCLGPSGRKGNLTYEGERDIPDGYALFGPAGSGHFVKMVHNGIEYAIMQAYAEGFDIMKAYPHAKLDLIKIAHTWRNGSVVASWLLDLSANALETDFDGIEPFVTESGEGKWTVECALQWGVPASCIAESVLTRFVSQGKSKFGLQFLNALRNQFGGHEIVRKKK
jgi:6-phosphogluconate dehydrogenase